jgi:K+-transporting ATPase ATPase C chain
MSAHLRALAVLFVGSLLLVCVVYPALLWAFGAIVAPSAASGSLVVEGGQVRGSLLLAQPFTEPRFFWPRPSAVDYNAAGSGPSNLAASNPLLRDRVARVLGPIVRYEAEPADRVGPDVQKWFASQEGLLGKWAKENPTLAVRWCKDSANEPAVRTWLREHPAAGGSELDLSQSVASALDDSPALAVAVLEGFAARNRKHWPVPTERQQPGRLEKETYLAAVEVGEEEIPDLQATLFDAWLHEHPAAKLRKVPADLVLTSGSGLDPHITLRNAHYQLRERVADEWARATGKTRAEMVRVIGELLKRHSFTPLAGLGGEPLVSVLEVNRALEQEVRP